MIQYKINIIDALKNAGFSSYKIRQEKLLGQATLQKIRQYELVYWENGKDYKVDQMIGEKKNQLVFMEFCSSSEISIQLICAVDKWGVKYELSHMPIYIDKNVKCVFACDVENMPLKIYSARCERKVVYKISGAADKKYILPQIKYFDRSLNR